MDPAGVAAAIQRVAGQRHTLPGAACGAGSNTWDRGVRAHAHGARSAHVGAANKLRGDRRRHSLFRCDGGAPAAGNILAAGKPVVHRVDFNFIPPGIGECCADMGLAADSGRNRRGLALWTGLRSANAACVSESRTKRGGPSDQCPIDLCRWTRSLESDRNRLQAARQRVGLLAQELDLRIRG